jgi:flagellar FliL protein
MASRDDGRDRVDEEEDDKDTPKAPKKRSDFVRLVIPGAIAIFLAVLGAQVAAPVLTHMLTAPGETDENAAEEEEEAEEVAEEAPPEEEPLETAALQPAIYTPLDPPLVVSFADDDGTRFLQLTLQAMARNEHAIDGIKQHAPAIRNAFLFLLSARNIDELMTLPGKESLRAEMTAKAQEILEANTGEPGLEELYFTSFVIQ